jgi:hypothetical protein
LPGQERPAIEQVAGIINRERYPAAAYHVARSVGHLQTNQTDFANAAQEAVFAVESVCKVLLNTPNATLGDCVKVFRRNQLVPREVARILESLWAYRSVTPGVGHGGVTVPSVPEAEAQLMLGLSAQMIVYLDSLWVATRGALE